MNSETSQSPGPEIHPLVERALEALAPPSVPTELPITLDSGRPRCASCIMLVFMWPFFFGAVALGFAALTSSGSDRAGTAFMAVVCLLASLSALFGAFSRRVVTVDRERVSLCRTLLGLPFGTWSEPLKRYEGLIYWVRCVRSGGSKGSSRETRRIHTITLRHAKRRRSIELMATELPLANMHELCEEYARLLDVPVLQQVAGEPFKRQVEDLDKSVWQLVREGKVKAGDGLPAAPPRQVSVEQAGEAEVVTVALGTATKAALVASYVILLLAFGGLGAMVLFRGKEAVEVFAALAVFPLFFSVFILAFSLRAFQQVSIALGPATIQVGKISRAGERGAVQTLPAESVEGIHFTPKGRLKFALTGGHVVSTRALGKDAGKWVCDYILEKYSSKLPGTVEERPEAAKREPGRPGEPPAETGLEAARDEREAPYPLSRLRSRWLSSVSLVVTNLIPLLGAWLLDWDVLAILLFYWLESLVAGGFGLLRILSSLYPGLVASRTKVEYAVQLVFFYGLFALFQGFCVLAIYHGIRGNLPQAVHPIDSIVGVVKGAGFPAAVPKGVELPGVGVSLLRLAAFAGIPLVVLLFSYGLSWLPGFLSRDESRFIPPRHLLESSYYKITTMIVACILGAFIAAGGSGSAVLVGVLIIKIGMDLGGHLGELNRLPRRRSAREATEEQEGSSFIVTCPECRRTHALPGFVAGGAYSCPSCQSVNRPPRSYISVSHRRGGSLFLNGFLITFPLLFAGGCTLAIVSLFQRAGPIPWQQTVATVQSSRVSAATPRGARSESEKVYVVWVYCRYTIDGVERTANKRAGTYDEREDAERVRKALSKTVHIYYDAKRPHVTSLERPKETSRPLEVSALFFASLALLISLGFTAGGVYLAARRR